MPAVVQAEVNGSRIAVRSPYEARELAASIVGGRWDKSRKVWTYPSTPSSANSIFATYTGANFSIECDREFVELCARARDQIAARSLKTADDLPEIPGEWCACGTPQPGDDEKGQNPYYCVTCARPLASWEHQKQAFHFAKTQDGVLLSIGMGGGKTKTAIALLEERDFKRVLIVCPNNVVPVWPKEFAKHGTHDWRVWAGEVLGRGGKPKKKPSTTERAAAIAEFIDRSGDKPVAIAVNYEGAWQNRLGELLSSSEWDCVILDESHRIKAPGGAASKFCGELGKRAGFRLALTGTPQPHSPLDIYAQARFIDPGVFGTNFGKFRKRYAVMEDIYVPGGRTQPVVVGYQREDELAQKIASFSFIISQEELDESLGLQVPTEYDRPVQISDSARKVYDDVWNQFVVDFGDQGEVVADNVLTRILRCQQITSGHVGTTNDFDEKQIVEVDTEKSKALADILEDLPQSKDGFEPIVVFCRFRHDLDQIKRVAEASGRKYGELSGRDKGGMTDQATMREDIDVLGVQINSGGVGIDLTRAAYAVYFSIGYSLGDYLQSRKRVHRPGQSRHVTLIHLIAQNTIDEVVYDALAQRKQIVDAVLDAAKASS